MYMSMIGAAAFMNWRGGLKTAQGIFWFAVGGVLGWPFAAALCAPFVFEEVFFAMFSDKDAFIEFIVRVVGGVIAGLIVVVCVPCMAWLVEQMITNASCSLETFSSTSSSTRRLPL